jgi:AcrR family transcriptional regulator
MAKADPTHANEPAFAPRGPEEHHLRDRIVDTAGALFDHFGYEKTAVADIAREVGISTAYVYKFFDSKAAIGEAVVSSKLGQLDAGLWAVARGRGSATSRFYKTFDVLLAASRESFIKSKRLHDLAIFATRERWPSVARHKLEMKNIFRHILMDWQAENAAARCNPEEDAAAIVDGLYLLAHPIILAEMINEDLELRARRLAAFFARAVDMRDEPSVTT